MNKNLRDYVQIFPGFIDPAICKATIDDLKQHTWKRAVFRNYNEEPVDMPGEEERFEFYGSENDYVNTTPALMDIIWKATHNYINHCRFHWWPSWNGYTMPKYNIYQPTSIMSEHCDHINGVFDGNRKGIPVLSVVGLLNDDFEGGEFVMFEDEEIPFNIGDIMVFPSLFLYPHKVNPIVTGTRFSMVSWVW